jgi:tRNA pseudouridine55 synthase
MMEKDKEGIILVNKPRGVTSHDVVDVVRKIVSMRKVGHAGTLDPLAEGLLIILVGKSTKLFTRFVNFDKEYIGVLKLGASTTTGDSQGRIVRKCDYSSISRDKIEEAFSLFQGEISQTPPMVSALRVKGRRLYKLARKGIIVNRKPRPVKVYSIKVLDIDIPLVKFYVHCSKGTYIRQLAEDIGEYLGCGAHITGINRVRIGPFKLEEAVGLDDINENHLQRITF